ncbi:MULTISPECIES: ATP-dependent endonuclease [unclassified Rhizobium]|uniref:ATP-dependent nuclease n=1 Tax=unclassified Rhizobium TaxID=2613769 RepID=UPI00247A03CB|nr:MULTISPECIES: AAA family ATPase [unclassified Rhizobium]MDH7802418.1 energy-coupling factor transporter ATP-binding protein EcfA2 [Rhizobium sp. AN70]
MKLRKFRVTNFRSIEDSGDVDVNGTLCLVGKNEAGKSAILYALNGFNPHSSTPFQYDVERDYPRRHLQDYRERHKGGDATVITTEWMLEESELEDIRSEFGPDALNSDTATISRGYNGKLEWDVPINYSAVVALLISQSNFNATEKAPLAKATTTDELRKALEALDGPTEKQKALLARVKAFKGHNVRGQIEHLLTGYLPAFMYFSHYDRMVGELRLDTYRARESGNHAPPVDAGERVFIDFLEYAGTSIDDIKAAQTFEGLNSKCEAASIRITDQLLEYWTQNPHLEIEVRVTRGEPGDPAPFNDGVVARARVKNNLHKVTVPFSERSAGFTWFFSFLVKFAQVRKGGAPLFLLLDEPGLTLHGKAQADLLRYFEDKLAPHHQLIFSTHSPFMVPTERLPEVRIVEDRVLQSRPGRWDSEGTRVRSDPLAVDRDTLFPLQGALGYELTQSLFVGKHTLLVEGPGDILFLRSWSDALGRRGRTTLNPKWTICPAGGIDKIQPFVSLFSGQNLNIAVLSDFALSDRKKFDTLRQKQILEDDRLLTFATLLGKVEADAEDVFADAVYLQMVNVSSGIPATNEITLARMESEGGESPRLLKKVESCMRLMPPETPEFNHYTPAAWLFQNPGLLDGDTNDVLATLERAETVIKALNKLLA